MDSKMFLDICHIAERLKDTPRHSVTSKGRVESVAEHSWRISLMALLLKDEMPDLDTDKLCAMCTVHDLGEAFTGDIPTFKKTDEDRVKEDELLGKFLDTLPDSTREYLRSLYDEIAKGETKEAKVFKCLDKLEALIQHNEAPLSSWSDNELELNKTYASEIVKFSPFLTSLREDILEETLSKIEKENN